MSEKENAPQARIQGNRRVSAVWIVPLVALGLGIWMVVHTFTTRGPLIDISFATAEGIVAGKTKIKALSVDVGQVESVSLNTDMSGVTVTARLEKAVSNLLRKDTQFWVVRPRIGSAGISGLGTLLSGAYIELSPGQGELGRLEFEGLEQVPITPAGTPGLPVTLVGEANKSLNTGDPVLYKGFTVGRVESVDFDIFGRQAYYQLFIEAPYNHLVTTNARFWDISGLHVQTSTDGLQVDTGSLESLLSGGVSFEVPQGLPIGDPIPETEKAEFHLYPNRHSAHEQSFTHSLDYVLLVQDTIRGLEVNAPVEYRGVRVGSVTVVNLLAPGGEQRALEGDRVAVLIRIEPARLGLPDTQAATDEVGTRLQDWVKRRGLRASLKAGNLLTGSLYVDLNTYDDAKPAKVEQFGRYTVLPTVPTGFAQLQSRVEAILEKLQQLPVEPVLHNASEVLTETTQTIQHARSTVGQLEGLLKNEATQAIPDSVNASLAQLNHTLQGVSADSPLYQELDHSLEKLQDLLWELQPLIRELNNKPNALIFSGQHSADPEPRRKQ